MLTGGSMGAAVAGANADWFNRQLHPDERNWIRNHTAEFAELLGITPEEAEKRLAQQAARQTDLLWMLTLEKVIDEPAQQFLAQAKNQSFVNENNKKQTFFTTQGKQFLRPEYFAHEANGDIGFYRKNLISRNNSVVTTGAKQLARKFGQKLLKMLNQNTISLIKGVCVILKMLHQHRLIQQNQLAHLLLNQHGIVLLILTIAQGRQRSTLENTL